MNHNYCIVCPGELNDEEKLTEYGSYSTGKYYCSECGIRYEFVPPLHLQKRPQQATRVEITWECLDCKVTGVCSVCGCPERPCTCFTKW